MRKSFAWLGGASLLVLGCGDDSGVTPGDESSSGGGTTTSPLTSSGPEDSSSSGGLDSSSSGGTTAAESSTTAMDGSTTLPVEECGNGVIEGEEVCDGTALDGEDCTTQGFDGGQLLCADDCSGYISAGCSNFACGNGIAEGPMEVCDYMDFAGSTCQSEGFDNGFLACSLDCMTLRTDGCGTCGDYIVDDEEVCDQFLTLGQTCESQGYSSGQLDCMPDCLTYDFSQCIMCGNDIIDGVEPCDGPDLAGADCVSEGYVGGTLACTNDCALDISGCNTCGNDLVDPGEGCDGANLDGETCASLGLVAGTLTCAPSCQFDFTSCEIPGVPFGSDSGYTGYEIEGAPLPCDNIVATGTATGLGDDNNITAPIGFTFTFYGVGYTNINIQSNGAVNFGTMTAMSLTNSCLPTVTAPNTNDLYVFWDDLNPAAAGASEVYYQTLGVAGNRRLVVQWEVAHYSGDTTDLIRVQAMFDEATGQINVCYPDTLSAANIGNNGAEATSGIQASSADGFDYSCNTPDLTNGLLLLYIPN